MSRDNIEYNAVAGQNITTSNSNQSVDDSHEEKEDYQDGDFVYDALGKKNSKASKCKLAFLLYFIILSSLKGHIEYIAVIMTSHEISFTGTCVVFCKAKYSFFPL